MDTQVLMWILGTIVTIETIAMGGLFKMVMAHNKDCADYRVKEASIVSRIDTNVERIMRDIGDHESGIRGEMHAQTNVLTQISTRLYLLDGKDLLTHRP